MLRPNKRLLAFVLIIVLIAADIFSPLRARQLSIRMAPEPDFQIAGFTITNTLLSSWLTMLLLIVLALLSRRNLVDAPSPRSLQNVIEAVFEALYNFMQNIAGPKAHTFFPIVGTFFLFILTSNWIGLLPFFGSVGLWEEAEGERTFIPLLRSTTSDLNTTIALAICAVLSLQVYSIRFLGFRGYISRFVPIDRLTLFLRSLAKGKRIKFGLILGIFLDAFVGLLEIFEDLTKILSFSFRLFGNIFGGEVLLLVIAFLVPYIVSVPFMALEIFGGFIQALIFAVLTTAFLARVTEGNHPSPAQGDEPTLGYKLEKGA